MMPSLWKRLYTQSDLLRHVMDWRQLADVRPFELSDGPERGVRGLHVRNAAGLDLTILADRGMGLYDVQFQGVPLAFLSSVGVTHPAHAEQPRFGWLRTWPGGFLTPCGLTQVGSPVDDDGEALGIHGRLSNLAAQQFQWGAGWQGDRYVLWAEGLLRETAVFGVNLAMRRRITTTLDEAKMWIEDRITNEGFAPAPLMILQHFNLGFPLVDSTTRLVLPAHMTLPRDEAARPGLDHCLEFDDPIDDYQEQVFYHDLQADAEGKVEVKLINSAFNRGQGLGVAWRYSKADYPILVEWKMMRAGFYAVGVEPGNCRVEGRVKERERGTLQTIAPQETRTFNLELEFFNHE
jgi:hypothetical protein